MSTKPTGKVEVRDLNDISEYACHSMNHVHTIFRAMIALKDTNQAVTDGLARLGIFVLESAEGEIIHWTASVESSAGKEARDDN